MEVTEEAHPASRGVKAPAVDRHGAVCRRALLKIPLRRVSTTLPKVLVGRTLFDSFPASLLLADDCIVSGDRRA